MLGLQRWIDGKIKVFLSIAGGFSIITLFALYHAVIGEFHGCIGFGQEAQTARGIEALLELAALSRSDCREPGDGLAWVQLSAGA